jgi:preprotein translocase subunit Sss1
MSTEMNMDERLWDYIDGLSSTEEKSFVEQLIESNSEWKAKYAHLMDTHQLMQNHLELDAPSMRFTQNVMEEIARLQIAPATKNYINSKIIWGIGIFFVTLLIGVIGYGLSQVNWSSGGDTNLPIDITKVNWDKMFNNTYTNAFIMINTVLGLMLIDMYLGKKKQERMNTK